MPVLATYEHRHITRGDASMDERKVHTLKLGRTTVHIVEPSPMSEEQIHKVLADLHAAGWAIIDELIQKAETEGREVDI